MISWIRQRCPQGDEGIGLILVMGIATIATTLVAVTGTIALSSLRESRQRVSFEQALATAENGIDNEMAYLQKAFDDYNADYPVPTTPTTAVPSPVCNAAPVDDPGSTYFATNDERTWAKAQIASLVAAHPECVRSNGEGQYVVFKPRSPLVNGVYPKYGRIYVESWVPSRTSPKAKSRFLKTEYVFLPYRPMNAVLTGGDLQINSSTTVTAAYGIDPTLAAIHTNGTVTNVLGNPSVSGPVSGTNPSSAQSNNFTANPGGTVTKTALQRIPSVSAYHFYFQAAATHPEAIPAWYDLCTDGSARPWSSGGPCTSATILNSGALNAFRGWSYNSGTSTWTASRTTQDGTYFVHYGDVNVGTGNGTLNNFTAIAEAQNATNCSGKKYGNITWDHYDLSAPAYTNLWMYADSDIVTGSNWTGGHGTTTAPVVSGMFVAGDQISLSTSSAGAVGSVVAADQCSTGNPDLVTQNVVQNPAIYYDPNSDAPFTSIINTTLWLEYTP